jgi:hypothetical protein
MEALLVIGGLAAAVWGAVLLLRGGLLAGCLAVLVAGVCLGYPLFHVELGPLPATIDRILWAVLLGQYVVWRGLGRTEPKPLGKAEIVLLAFVAVMTVNTLSHDWRIHNSQPLAKLIFYYFMPLAVFWVARQSPLTERGGLAVFGCMTALGIYLSITAVAETRGWNWLVFPGYITSPQWPEFLGRGRGPLLTPIGNGFFLGTCMVAALLWWPRVGRWGKVAVLGVTLLIGLGVVVTMTRSVWIGAGLGTLIVIALPASRRWRIGLAGGVLAVAALAATRLESLVAFKRDRGLSAQETAESVKLRPVLAAVAWRMFCDRPAFGCGFGQYREQSRDYLGDRTSELPLEKARPYVQHNTFLALLTETGLAGLGLFAILLAMWGYDAWRLWRSAESPLWARQFGLLFLAVVANYVVNAMFHDMAITAMANMLLFFTAGINAGLRARASRPCSGWGGRLTLGLDPRGAVRGTA